MELSETKYTEPAAVAALDERAAALAEQLARACTEWLLRDDALTGFTTAWPPRKPVWRPPKPPAPWPR